MYQLKINQADVKSTPLEIPGVSMKILYTDAGTGGMAVLTRMEPGATIPRHSHTHADEKVYVLEGDFIEEGEAFGPGSYFVGKAKTTHGPHQTEQGCLVLTHFSAEFDFVLA